MKNKKEILEKIKNLTKTCTQCDLHSGIKSYVPGTGNPDAKIVFLGEAPGVAEDNTGVPFASQNTIKISKCVKCIKFNDCFSNFISKILQDEKCEPNFKEEEKDKNIEVIQNFSTNAGELFDELLHTCNLTRNDIFLTNTVACRPVDSKKNGKPSKEQIELCMGRALWQIQTINPVAVVCIGGVALQALSKYVEVNIPVSVGESIDFLISNNLHIEFERIKDLGNFANYRLFAIYHPAAMLHNPNNKEPYMKKSKEVLEFIKHNLMENTKK